MCSVKRLIFVPFDQLHYGYGALAGADPESDTLLLVESAQKIDSYRQRNHRLHFYLSSARHFAQEMTQRGFEVIYERAPSIPVGIAAVRARINVDEVVCTTPSTFGQQRILTQLGVKFVDNDFFLTPRALFDQWANGQKTYVMESFYRAQRVRLGILMDGSKPEGGQWNFDKENRLPPPNNYTWLPYLTHEVDEIDLEVAREIGFEPAGTWATSRSGARAQLKNFVDNHLAHFGPLEDAMTTENWALHHSLLSPYLNIGLLHVSEVLEAVLARHAEGDIPIASTEGFVRQLIGWREYVNGMYWHLGADYKNSNNLGATGQLPEVFADSAKTQMRCVGSVVRDVAERGWVHHIPRLMVLSNFALLAGINPQAFLRWMQDSFIDATEWVMVPNVIGMGLHADGGQLMTKPYVSGGAYISKMSDYCKGCKYNPKLRAGDSACPFTTLYWDFLDRHESQFASNHRMKQQYFGLRRLADRDALKARANEVLSMLEQGTL
jgi:deoxyribodipyrimidine photolyase-related protein